MRQIYTGCTRAQERCIIIGPSRLSPQPFFETRPFATQISREILCPVPRDRRTRSKRHATCSRGHSTAIFCTPTTRSIGQAEGAVRANFLFLVARVFYRMKKGRLNFVCQCGLIRSGELDEALVCMCLGDSRLCVGCGHLDASSGVGGRAGHCCSLFCCCSAAHLEHSVNSSAGARQPIHHFSRTGSGSLLRRARLGVPCYLHSRNEHSRNEQVSRVDSDRLALPHPLHLVDPIA